MNTIDLIPMSESAKKIYDQVFDFIETRIKPSEALFKEQLAQSERLRDGKWMIPPVLEELKQEAKNLGLWNLFLPDTLHGRGLGNVDYAPIAELTGHSFIAPEIFNCQAPDSGNIELLHMYGNEEQNATWLLPLLSGDIRSAFLMTEPEAACSDATNVSTQIVRDGDDYVINGRKWWITNAGDPRCKIYIVMGKTDNNADPYRQQSMILVPADTEGVKIERMLSSGGYEHAPQGHGEVVLNNVRVPAKNLILGEGRGFEIAQGRLGPGRIHHCMRLIGAAEKCLSLMCNRLASREAFGKPLVKQTIWQQRVAELRMDIDMARLLTLNAAHVMDLHGAKAARKEIAMIKVVAPKMAQKVADMAIQSFGAAGLTQDTDLPEIFAGARALRIADGPDEVHELTIAKYELKSQLSRHGAN
ncbi:acyl-CoA dehydrogenase family protein [Maricurvus nonylphenolicus]|uniref:acyl-CoA dehydrogenase family protein n=1 Tax=Maricurvus nonylphenolicus TaxID=1008307 RepID=UPI0036F35B0F